MKLFCHWMGLAGLLLLPVLSSRAQAPELAVDFLNGGVQLHWTNNPPFFRLESRTVLNETEDWQPVVMATVLDADNRNTVTLPPSGLDRFFRLGPTPLTTIAESSPVNGEIGVGVMRETILRFSTPLATNTLFTPDNFFAGFQGRRLLSRIELGNDRRTAALFYLEPLPAGSQVTAVFDSTGLTDEMGRALDPDGDGHPGGTATVTFQTFGSTPLTGTAVIGHVYASELMPGMDNVGTTNRPLAGVTITVDGQEQTLRTVTDAKGYFSLSPCPAGRFFVKIDGRTAAGSQYPLGAYYPFVGKPWEAVAGKTNNLAGGTGEIFLPKIAKGTLTQVSPLTNTTITFPPSVIASNPALEGVSVMIPANSLYSNDGTRGGRVGIAPVSPDRLPAPLPAGINPALVITIQTDGPNNFDRPAPMRFPNLPDRVTGRPLAPGGKSALWGFNHKTGRWEIQGAMTASADGKFIETDPGVGVRQPGWEFPNAGSDGSGGGGGDGGDGGGDGGGGGDPCKTERKSLESAGIQCALGAGIGILSTLAKATPGASCAIAAAQGVIGAVADCNIDPTSCKTTIAQNLLNTAIGCIPVVGLGFDIASTAAGIAKSCLIDAGGAYGAYKNCKRANGLDGRPPGGRPLPAAPGIPENVFAEQVQLLQDAARLEALVFGSVKWTEVELTEVPTSVAFLTAVQAATQPGSPGDARVTDEEKSALMQLPLPSNLTAADAAALLDRFDRMAAGTLADAEFDTGAIQQAAQQLQQTMETLIGRGWVTTYDAFLRGLPGIFTDEDQAQQHAGTPLVAKPLAYRLANLSLNGAPQFGHLNLLGQFDNLPLEANAYYQIDYFDRDNFTVGHTVFQAGDNGAPTVIPRAAMNPANPLDSDHDGLPDEVETILGTDPQKADTDGDGVSDGAEVVVNADPLDGVVGFPRIIGSLPVSGPALQVAVRGSHALVAEGDSGLGIYNVSQAQPTLVARLELGTVNAVAFQGSSGLATVGRTGLAVIDLSNPVQPTVTRFIGLAATADFGGIAVAGDLAYVISGDSLYLVDLAAGGVLDHRSLSPLTQEDTPQDIAVSGGSVYLLTGNVQASSGRNYLHRFNVGRTLGDDTASLLLAGTDYHISQRTHLAPGPGVVYVTGLDSSPTPYSSSLTVISDSPSELQLTIPQAHVSVFGLAATGSGAVVAGGANVLALDVHDPANGVPVLAAFGVPARVGDVALDQGRAYVAYGPSDGTGGLAVVNFLAPDTLGHPPTISLGASFSLAPAIVEPEVPVVVTAFAVDDVQVRNVEFYLNGVLAENVGAYPFDFRFTTPATTNQASFTLKARAFDTGGNVATTTEITVLVQAGARPPAVTSTVPLMNAVLPPGLVAVQAAFAQPLNPATVTASSLQLVSAGVDGLLGTVDDQVVDGSTSYDPATQRLQFTPATALPVGDYRATVSTEVTGLNGIHPVTPYTWNFSQKSAVTWGLDASGTWLTDTNWTSQTLPLPGDFVLIDRTNGTYTVSYGGGSLSLDSLFSREPIAINSGTFSLARRSRIENSLTLTAATLSVASELDVTGGFNWPGGTLDGGGTTLVGGELAITGTGPRMRQHTLVNLGHATWNQPNNFGILVNDPAATIRNAKGAVWEAFDRQIMVFDGPPSAGRFDNDGLFRALGNDGGINFSQVAFNNNGTVSVESGSLKLNGGGQSGGTFEIAAPAALELGGDHIFALSSSIHGAGAVRFRMGNINVNGSYDVAGITQFIGYPAGPLGVNFNGPIHNLGTSLLVGSGCRVSFLTPDLNVTNDIVVAGGSLEFSPGQGVVTPSSLTLTNNAHLLGTADVEVAGKLVLQIATLVGPGSLTAHGDSTLGGAQFYTIVAGGKRSARPFINAGAAMLNGDLTIASTLRNLAGATFDIPGNYGVLEGSIDSSSAFINAGTIRRSAGTGNARIPVALRNTGLIEVLTGKLQLGDFSQTAGEIRLAGAAITGLGVFDLKGGSLTGTGDLEIYPFNNPGGVVSPGLPDAPIGILHATGLYMQGPAATLVLDLASTTPGTGFDQFNVDIQASLGGTLLIRIAPGYQPTLGDTFRVLTTASRVGTFATISTTGLGAGLKLVASYDSTGVTLTVVAGP